MKFRSLLLAVLLNGQVASAFACDLIPFKREPTVAEQVAGLEMIFGGTVVGYELKDGTQLLGPMPAKCLDDAGDFPWWDSNLDRECTEYLDTEYALFRVDVPIVGPAVGETASFYMTWGDGDCNIDFEVGDKWLIAGFHFTQRLREPIREDEIAALRRMAAKPAFDFSTLY